MRVRSKLAKLSPGENSSHAVFRSVQSFSPSQNFGSHTGIGVMKWMKYCTNFKKIWNKSVIPTLIELNQNLLRYTHKQHSTPISKNNDPSKSGVAGDEATLILHESKIDIHN